MKKGKGAKGHGAVCECGTCSSVQWILPLVLLIVALVPGWLTSMWGKWVVIVVAVLYLIKRVKPCKACMGMCK